MVISYYGVIVRVRCIRRSTGRRIYICYTVRMRLGILFLILIATVFGSGYWYSVFSAPCKVPIRYHIGTVDERFGAKRENLIAIAKKAEAMWEEKLGKELFIYDEQGDLPVNFIFDERQKNADLEAELKEDLEAKKGMSDGVAEQYQALIKEFRTVQKNYETRVGAYESSLSAYNNEVGEWNRKGGVPPEHIQELKKKEQALNDEKKSLEVLAKKLNSLVVKLNAIGAKGNGLVKDYNTVVSEYNARFNEASEFTQGDYTGDAIHIYQFDSDDELIIVLVHEFGHALSLGHVAGEKSVMYHLMEKQRITDGLSKEDIAEFDRVCNQERSISSIVGSIFDL